ncbi:MAG: beta-galactosidase [Kiritimatiellae bacterium]|nr:beta-galactosidase [Kiritimatiellia bacterium]
MKTSKIIVALLTCVVLTGPEVSAFDSFITMQDGYFYDPGAGEPWVAHGIAYQTWNRPLGVWQTYDQIDYDLDEMVKMGANSVRIDIVWQHAEEQGDDVFSWDNYDYFIQACEQRGLRIFALVGYQWPPSWFPDEWYTMHPPAVDAEGMEHTNRWQSDIINYEHPDAQAEYAEWIDAVCSRYKDEKAIVAWIVGNEYGYLGLWSGLQDGYDPETEQAFRNWCSNEYGTVSAVNAAWGTDYASFEDIVFVEEYRAYGPEGAEWADMVQFREESIADFVALSAAAAKNADTNHLLTYSTVGMQWGEEDWRYHAEDRGKITEACEDTGAPLDFFSVNNYPWSILGHESQNGQWGVSYTKKVAGVPVLYTETGFTSSETMWPGMTEARQGPLVRNSLWEGLEAGAIGTHIFTWQDRPYITDREKGFGIVYGDRRIKPAMWVCRDTYNLMDQVRLSELLAGSADPDPDIAFLWTDANDSQYNRYECEMQQIAGALERLGYEPNFMTLQDLADGAYTNYAVIVLPRNMRVEEAVPGYTNSVLNFLLTKVIEAGVHVLASADIPGLQNANAQERAAYVDEVDALFGVDASDIGGEEAPQAVTVFVSWHWNPIDITFTTNAVGPVGTNYAYTALVWKYNDEIEVTDGELWATMDARRNKGFEDSNTNCASWDGTWGNVEVRNGWGWAYEGDNMVQMWDESGLWEDFDILPHGRYTHSAYLRSNSDDPLRGGSYALAALEWYDEDDNLLGVEESAHLASATPSASWVKYAVDATAPAEAAKARRMIRLKEASTNLVANGTLTGTGNAPDNWSSWNSDQHDPDTNTCRSAGNAWTFWYDGGIYQGITSGFGEGDTITFGGYLLTPSSDALRNGAKYGIIQAEFYDEDESLLSTASASPTITSNSAQDAWIYAEEEAAVPAGAVTLRVVVRCNDYSSGDGRFLADDVFARNATYFPNMLVNGEMDTGSSTYDVYNDSGVCPTSTVYTWAGDWGCTTFNSYSTNGCPTEGTYCFETRSCSWAGWGVFRTSGTEDLSAYSNGYVMFAVKSDQQLKIEIEAPAGTKGTAYIPSTTGVWQDVSIALADFSGVDLSQVHGFFLATASNPTTNYVDNVRWVVGSDSAPVGWEDWNSGQHDPDTSSYRSAETAWAFWNDGGIYQDLSDGLYGDDTVKFGGFLRTPSSDALRNGTKYGVVQIELYNGTNLLSTTSASPTISSNSPLDTWVRAEGSVAIPTNATSARVVVRCNDYSSGDGRFLADDIFLVNDDPGGSVFADGKQAAPAIVVKDHGNGKGKTAIFLYSVGDNKPDGDEDGDMDTIPWEYRYDVFKSMIGSYFGVEPAIEVTGTNGYLCLAEYRTCTNGAVLLQVKNYLYEPDTEDGGGGLTFEMASDLFAGKTIEAFGRGEVIEEDSDGAISLPLEPDGMEMLLVYETGAVSQIVHITDAPALVHPFGTQSYPVDLKYDCLGRTDLTLRLAFKEDGDNGDGTTNEIYESAYEAVTGSGEATLYIYIPDPDLEDTDYISTADGGAYEFAAWLEDASNNAVVEAVPQATQLKWGARPADGLPAVLSKGGTTNVTFEWEDLYEYLSWENTPIARNDAFAGRVAVFRSSKTEAQYPGHYDRANEVCEWLESMGYAAGNDLDISFDNIVVSNLFSDDFNDGNMDGWTRTAGCANWEVQSNTVHAWRLGNDDNIMIAGSAWTNYSVSADIRYNEQGPYFNDAEVYVRYQDRDNFIKVGLHNYYGSWRVKYTVRVSTNDSLAGWLYYFSRTNPPTENTWYNLRVDAQGSTYTVYLDGEEIGSFTATNFATGQVGIGTKAAQLGIWEPQYGYYFVDDDEYGQDRSPLNMDWGYLNEFYPTLILPSVYVMNDAEASNLVTFANLGMKSVIATDGGVAMKDETGSSGLGRVEDVFGVSASVSVATNLTTLMFGGEEHYVTLDYSAGEELAVSGTAQAWPSVSGGTGLATVSGSAAVPALIVNKITTDPEAPGKVVCFNFGADTGGQLTDELATVAQRVFEWARGEAFRVAVELKFDTQTTDAWDFVVFSTTGWILSGSGTNTIVIDVPTNGIMTGETLYWVIYAYPWDAEDPYGEHAGFYSSENDGTNGVYTSIDGIGLQILGITAEAYCGRDWDNWLAYNTRTQAMVLTFGIKDKGLIDDADDFDDEDYTGWTVTSDPNISWTVTNSALRATVVSTGGYAYITRDGFALSDTNITIEYDVLFENGAANGGLVYRGRVLYVNPGVCGWDDASPDYYTTKLPATGAWAHVVLHLRDGDPYLKSDLYVDNVPVFRNEPAEFTNWTGESAGLLSPYYAGYIEWDNWRLSDEKYAIAYSNVNGIGYPVNDVPTETWPSIPDYDPDMWEHMGTALGAGYEWFVYLRGQGVDVRQDVEVYFSPRLQIESTNFPLTMYRGSTVSVPLEWEGLGTNPVAKLRIALEEPYLGTNFGSAEFDITNASGSGSYTVTILDSAPAGTSYNWMAMMYPVTATNPTLQRIGLDDTFRFTPEPFGSPVSPENVITVHAYDEIFVDAGIPVGCEIFTWAGDGGNTVFDGNYTNVAGIPEGEECFYTKSGGGTYTWDDWAGWGVFATNNMDMGEFEGGYVKFFLKSRETLTVELEGPAGTKGTAYVASTTDVWTEVTLALTNFPSLQLTNMYGLFMITSTGPTTNCVDNVRWTIAE